MLARLDGGPYWLDHPFVMLGSPSQPGRLFSLKTIWLAHVTSVNARQSEHARALFAQGQRLSQLGG